MNKGLTGIALTSLLCGIQVAGTALEQKPIREERTHLLGSLPPATPEEMAAQAEAVVIARNRGPVETVERPAGGLLVTYHSLEVLDVLKGHAHVPAPGGLLHLGVHGGEKELPEYVRRVTVAGARGLLRNRTYVVFLNWNPHVGEPVLPWGAASLFDVSDGYVHALADVAKSHDGGTAKSFIERSRAK